jgi:hypothetical protein
LASKPKIAAVVGMLCEAFNRKATPATYKAYEVALSDIPDDLLGLAGNATLTSNRDFMPTPGQLRELAVTGGCGYATRAERAWLEFDRAVARHGADHSVSFADGLINATVRTIGDWIFCCGRVGEDYSVWLRKQFIETYMRLCIHGASESLRQPLMGSIWKANVEFPNELLDKLPRLNAGQVQAIETRQPVLLPPSETPKQIAQRPTELPRLKLRKAT